VFAPKIIFITKRKANVNAQKKLLMIMARSVLNVKLLNTGIKQKNNV
jgi:hypothetical protein